MKFRAGRFAFALLSAPMISSVAGAEDKASESKPVALSPEALRLADVWLQSEQAYRRIPAMSAAIVQGDRTVFLTGYGAIDADRKVPATGQTLYSICSISKLFTSIALMQQYEAGKVRLDEPVTTYLPWAKLKPLVQDSMPVTLRTLLTHSSGLPRDFSKGYWMGPDFTFPDQREVETTLPEQTPLWPASRWFQYSNLGLTLVGDTVSAVAGTPYDAYVKARLLAPLGMKDTYLGLPMALYGKRLAVGWGSIDRTGDMQLLKPFDTRAVTPAAGYVSTAEDLSRFASWQFRLLRSERADVLKASSLREMQRVQFLDPDWTESWGLGFQVWRAKDQTYVGHGGACPGYKTALTLRPATETAVVVLMTGMGDASARAEALFDVLDKRKSAKDERASGSGSPDLEAYAGMYSAQPWASEVAVVPWAGGLALLTLPSSNPAKELTLLKPAGKDAFHRIRGDGSEADIVRFERDPAGKVVDFRQFSVVQTRTGDLPAAGRGAPGKQAN